MRRDNNLSCFNDKGFQAILGILYPFQQYFSFLWMYLIFWLSVHSIINIVVATAKVTFFEQITTLRISTTSTAHCCCYCKGNLALICRKWCLDLLLSHVCGTRAVQKGAKKPYHWLPPIVRLKGKGARNEHLNYHLLSFVIIDYHDLFSDALSSHPWQSSALHSNRYGRNISI